MKGKKLLSRTGRPPCHRRTEPPGDQAGVIAFSSSAEWISRLRPCSGMAEKEQLAAAIDAIAPNADTFMFPAMEIARDALQNAAAELKHALLLTDGISQPGNFGPLAAEMAAAGITVSTVGLGPEVAGSPAGRLLAEIAAAGKGQTHFCPDASMLPTVFAAETTRAGKSASSNARSRQSSSRPPSCFPASISRVRRICWAMSSPVEADCPSPARDPRYGSAFGLVDLRRRPGRGVHF